MLFLFIVGEGFEVVIVPASMLEEPVLVLEDDVGSAGIVVWLEL